MKLLIQLVREILHLSGKSQGKVREFQTPMAVATMFDWPVGRQSKVSVGF